MVLTNELMKLDEVPTEALVILAKLLHPFAPHLGEEAWEMLGRQPSIQPQAWPTYDPALCEQDEVEVPVQINGKVRDRISVPADLGKAELEQAAKAAPKVADQLSGQTIVKTIVIPGRMVNFVVK